MNHFKAAYHRKYFCKLLVKLAAFLNISSKTKLGLQLKYKKIVIQLRNAMCFQLFLSNFKGLPILLTIDKIE